MVENSLLHFDAHRYHLLAWVVMPNHVHVLFQPADGWTAGKIAASWKKFTARKICDYLRNASLREGGRKLRRSEDERVPIGSAQDANPEIGVPGAPVWHRECWDRYMRDERHLLQTIEYIHQNPVKAGLAPCAEAWSWSSARIPGAPISEEEEGRSGGRWVGEPRLASACRQSPTLRLVLSPFRPKARAAGRPAGVIFSEPLIKAAYTKL